MRDDKRELATNKLLEILRTGKEPHAKVKEADVLQEDEDKPPQPEEDESTQEVSPTAEKKGISFSELKEIALSRIMAETGFRSMKHLYQKISLPVPQTQIGQRIDNRLS